MLMGGGGLMRVGLSCEWRVKVDVHGGGGLMWVDDRKFIYEERRVNSELGRF